MESAKLLDQQVTDEFRASGGEQSDEEMDNLWRKLKETENVIKQKRQKEMEMEKEKLRYKIAVGEKELRSMKGEVKSKTTLTELRQMSNLNKEVDKKLSKLGLIDDLS